MILSFYSKLIPSQKDLAEIILPFYSKLIPSQKDLAEIILSFYSKLIPSQKDLAEIILSFYSKLIPSQKDLARMILSFYSKLACYVISKLSFMSNLNLLESYSKTSKSSKVRGEARCNRWSDIADSLVFLIQFPARFEIPMCSSALVKLMSDSFFVISNFAVTTCLFIYLFIYFIYLIHYLFSITRSYKTNLHRVSIIYDTLK